MEFKKIKMQMFLKWLVCHICCHPAILLLLNRMFDFVKLFSPINRSVFWFPCSICNRIILSFCHFQCTSVLFFCTMKFETACWQNRRMLRLAHLIAFYLRNIMGIHLGYYLHLIEFVDLASTSIVIRFTYFFIYRRWP